MHNRLIRTAQLALYPLLGVAALALVSRRKVLLRPKDLKAGRSYLLVPNHQSYLDIPMISACLPAGVLWRLGPGGLMLLTPIFGSRMRPLLAGTGFFPATQHSTYAYGLDMARL